MSLTYLLEPLVVRLKLYISGLSSQNKLMAKKLNCFQGLYPETNNDKPALSTSQLGYSQFHNADDNRNKAFQKVSQPNIPNSKKD